VHAPLRLGIVTTHPIQYQAPLFRELTARPTLNPTVYFGRLPDAQEQGEGFGTTFRWDLPLLEGYAWKVLDEGAGASSSYADVPCFRSFGEAYDDVDVMLIHGWQARYMHRAWWHGLRRPMPLLVRGESNAMRSRPWYVRLLHRLYLMPYDGYLYIGESSRRFFRRAGAAPEALFPARYCVENERFDADWKLLEPRREDVRRQLGIAPGATCFVFCGKFIEKKRPLDVVRGFLAARERSAQSMHLLMVGDGELRAVVEEHVPREAPITLTGFLNQTEIGEAYAAADVMVLPSNYGETWGLVVNEGMVFELPALVSDRVGCGPDLVRDGETGFVFPFGDTEALASRMAQCADDAAATRRMGAAARRLVMNQYTVAQAADGIEQAARDAHRQCTHS
jgi:glycosyltransferase involved in cell wall biosynthesis